MKIKPPSVAGKFYPGDKNELLKVLKTFKDNGIGTYNYYSRAIILPHAGYFYSGQLASEGFSQLDKSVKNIFVIAPPHQFPVSGIALSSYDKWLTPLGEIELNTRIVSELQKEFGCEIVDEAFAEEHSVEVQLPFIQTNYSDVKIIPLLAGSNIESLKKIIEHYWKDSRNAFVISSDLSHFLSNSKAEKIDNHTAKMIENKDVSEFDHRQACGSIGVCALVEFAKNNSFSFIRIGLMNSSFASGETSRVVGYGSWMLYEGEKNSFLKRFYSSYIVSVCKKSILAGFKKQRPIIENVPVVFEQDGACFVTLEKNEELRGCIGSIIAYRKLIDDLVINSQNSAFSDPRFAPLKEEEFDKLNINISLLSEPKKLEFSNEEELLNLIKPFEHGIIIKDGVYQAVYLPSVWEQLPDKEEFLTSLKMKAGLSPTHFSRDFEAYFFSTEYVES